jgi:hypothetical protein
MEDVSMGRVEFDRDTQQQLIEQTQKGYDFLVNINKDYSRALLAQEKNRYELQKQERKVENEEAQQANKDAYQAREALLINQYQNEEITEAEFQQAKTDNLNEYLLNIQNIEQDFKRQGELDAELNFNTIRRIVEENAEKEINITKNKNRILKALEKDKQDAQLAGVQIASDAAGTLAEIAGQETELGKAFAIIQTTLSTYQAAQQAYASQLTIPTPDAPIRAQIAAGVAIAAGLARVVAIQNTDTSGVKAADGLLVGQGSGRMDNIPVRVSAGESIINARSTSMFKPLLSAINQAGGGRRFASGGITSLSTQTSPETNLLNQISQLQGNTPIKTYVVSTDVSSSVSLDRQIKSRSVL